MGKKLDDVSFEIKCRLADIGKMFKPGVKLTLLVRTPGEPERDLMISGDTTAGIREIVERSEKREAQ